MKESQKLYIEEFYAKLRILESDYNMQLIFDTDLLKDVIYNTISENHELLAIINNRGELEFENE